MNKRNAHPKIIVSLKKKWAPWINSPKLKPSSFKYQSPDFPWYTARDVLRPWLFLTRRNGRIKNIALSDRSHFLTRQVPDLGHAECREISRQRKFLEITCFLQYSAYLLISLAMRTPHTALHLSFCEVWGEVLPAAVAVVRLPLIKCQDSLLFKEPSRRFVFW